MGRLADHRMVPALIVLAVSAITDSLDGIIARASNQVSKESGRSSIPSPTAC